MIQSIPDPYKHKHGKALCFACLYDSINKIINSRYDESGIFNPDNVELEIMKKIYELLNGND